MLLAIGREILEHSLMSTHSYFVHHHPDAARNTLRITIVVVILGMAYTAEYFAANAFYNVVSLVGGICGFTLGFIYPPAMYVMCGVLWCFVVCGVAWCGVVWRGVWGICDACRYMHVFAHRMSTSEIALNVFIVVLGVVLLLSSTYFNIVAF